MYCYNSLTQWLLLEEKEHGVNEFEVLGKVVELVQSVSAGSSLARRSTYVVQNNKFVGPTAIVGANSVEDTISGDLWNQLLKEKNQKSTRDGSQHEVVDLEDEVELERRPFSHQFPTTEDDDVV